jgi:hypothetical protein
MDNLDIIVLCGGKCGSSTLVKTFDNNGYKTIHTHNIHSLNNKYKSYDEFINLQKKNDIYIFDSYRTPIERNISAFFQNIKFYIKKPINEINIDMLIYWYNKYFIDCDNYHPLDGTTFSIFNDYEFNFDKEYIENTVKFKNKNVHFIKLRFKSIETWDKILSEILGKTITVFSDNLSENKEYYELYKNFKLSYLVPIEYLNKIQKYDTFIRYNNVLEKKQYVEQWLLKSMVDDLFEKKITVDIFKNIPDDFDAIKYNELNSFCYSDIDCKIHYEFVGYYTNLPYKIN